MPKILSLEDINSIYFKKFSIKPLEEFVPDKDNTKILQNSIDKILNMYKYFITTKKKITINNTSIIEKEYTKDIRIFNEKKYICKDNMEIYLTRIANLCINAMILFINHYKLEKNRKSLFIFLNENNKKNMNQNNRSILRFYNNKIFSLHKCIDLFLNYYNVSNYFDEKEIEKKEKEINYYIQDLEYLKRSQIYDEAKNDEQKIKKLKQHFFNNRISCNINSFESFETFMTYVGDSLR